MAAILRFLITMVGVAFATCSLLIIYESTKPGGYKKECERQIVVSDFRFCRSSDGIRVDWRAVGSRVLRRTMKLTQRLPKNFIGAVPTAGQLDGCWKFLTAHFSRPTVLAAVAELVI